MSRTYKYPRESLDDSIVRDDQKVVLRIEKKLKMQRGRKKRIRKVARSFKAFMHFRDKYMAKDL